MKCQSSENSQRSENNEREKKWKGVMAHDVSPVAMFCVALRVQNILYCECLSETLSHPSIVQLKNTVGIGGAPHVCGYQAFGSINPAQSFGGFIIWLSLFSSHLTTKIPTLKALSVRLKLKASWGKKHILACNVVNRSIWYLFNRLK